MKKFTIILFCAALLGFSACTQDDDGDSTPTPPTKTELLTANLWIRTAITVDPPVNVNGTPITDLFAQLDNCEKDDVFKYNSNGTYSFEEGVSKCSSTDPQVFSTGTWLFSSNEQQLVLNSGGSPESYTIKELSSSTFVITSVETINNINHTVKITYSPN